MNARNKRQPFAIRLVRIAIFMVLITLTTCISFPTGIAGNINLGDAVICAAVFFLGFWAIPAAAVGCTLADLMTGYVHFAPATFVIKGLMALIMAIIFYKKNSGGWILAGMILASAFMQAAYALYIVAVAVSDAVAIDKAFLLGLLPGLIQTVIAVPLAYLLVWRLKRFKILWDEGRLSRVTGEDDLQ